MRLPVRKSPDEAIKVGDETRKVGAEIVNSELAKVASMLEKVSA